MFTARLDVYNICLGYYRPKIPIQQADPSAHTMATPTILKHLVRLDKNAIVPDPAYQAMRHKITKALPIEINAMITAELEPFYNLSREQLTCTRVLPPEWWKENLLSGKLIPSLFDIDEGYPSTVKQKFTVENHEPFDIEKDLDWELLCRQLGQKDVFEPGGILLGAKGLENDGDTIVACFVNLFTSTTCETRASQSGFQEE
ncbi:hypothetical protein F5Y00DRAFT_249377 [Daldinia vernicosa]|uniref:uncharacterized protein n=1 Tax=Daldinia vernicosa TaxID=114800 RepID=UPI0020076326|nr:uncharacterized protein F5Y00DRAFT_249377 [Daldinia vernicosa]KAI0844120.1 hypothetical protein F5Y00DRAFT_249377 [Daldinia vernicosa]